MYGSTPFGSMVDSSSRLARAVLKENLKVKKGESVVIESWTHALPYARAFVEEARRLGARPTVLYEDEEAWWNAVGAKQYSSVGALSDVERAAIKSADVFIYFWGPEDRPRVNKLPDSAQERVVGWNEEWYRLARKSGLRGCRMSVAQATDPAAAAFGLDGAAWRSRLLEAGAGETRPMIAKGNAFMRALDRADEVRIRHPNGTDLTFQLEGLHHRVDVGMVDDEAMKRPYGMLTNNPSGQVLVAVDRSRANGRFVSNRAVYLGPNRFGDVDWKFSDGKLVEQSIGLGGDVFQKEFAAAPAKGRDMLGYFSLGLNPGSRDLPPVEDTEEGAILIGIGSNGMAGGRVRIPFVGYALLGEGLIELDGKPVAKGGRVLTG